jgi:hypothetical protein
MKSDSFKLSWWFLVSYSGQPIPTVGARPRRSAHIAPNPGTGLTSPSVYECERPSFNSLIVREFAPLFEEMEGSPLIDVVVVRIH